MFIKVMRRIFCLALAINLFAIAVHQDGQAMWGEPTPNYNIPQPDLIVSSLEVISVSATSITYEYEIKNIGDATADIDGQSGDISDNVAYQGVISMDTIYENGIAGVGGGYLLSPASLEPGETFTKTVTSGPAIDPRTANYLIVKIDHSDVLPEANENNNTGWGTIPKPDLIVSSVEVTSVSATTISYEFEIKNIGDETADIDGPTGDPSDNIAYQAVLSMDTDYENGIAGVGGGYLLSPASLEPGETFTKTATSGPSIDPRSANYLVVKIDQFNVLPESNDDNNTGWAPIAVNKIFLPMLIN
jgi:hypothetical protein